ITLLQEKKTLLHHEFIQHSYPHCWRHKKPIIFRATPQWFINIDTKNLRNNALREIKKVLWYPQWGESRIIDMLKKRPDWCISRQRTWGIPICIFINKKTGDLHPNTTFFMKEI
ncbi:MAG: class I tRNA ligase family protein, partial [Buchnera aphidicola]|nr:class I tRNA ligase family protein [Buchnera aphidicola]